MSKNTALAAGNYAVSMMVEGNTLRDWSSYRQFRMHCWSREPGCGCKIAADVVSIGGDRAYNGQGCPPSLEMPTSSYGPLFEMTYKASPAKIYLLTRSDLNKVNMFT
jgi:hypothetical protein